MKGAFHQGIVHIIKRDGIVDRVRTQNRMDTVHAPLITFPPPLLSVQVSHYCFQVQEMTLRDFQFENKIQSEEVLVCKY